MMTLFVDASFDAKTGSAGWGAWAKCDLWINGRSFGGPINTPCKNSAEAELCGIANSLCQINPFLVESKIRTVVLQCDNTRALGAILTKVHGTKRAKIRNGVYVQTVNSLTPLEAKAVEKIAGLNLNFFVRHVRGHSSGDGRQGVNNMCDLLAKSYMRTIRAKRLEVAA